MEFNRVINGIVKYINKEMLGQLNPWQEVLARVSISRVLKNTDSIKNLLTQNAFIKTFAIVDDTGNVDVDGLMEDLKTIIKDKGVVEIDIPLFGTFKFNENDINTLNSYIRSV